MKVKKASPAKRSAKSATPAKPASPAKSASAVSPPPRKAHGVDPGIKADNLQRLARISGQVGGLVRMIEADRYCPEILLQIDSVQEALRGVSRLLLRNHLRHCAREALSARDEARAEATIDELVELLQRYRR